ncbi:hypothetical protein EMCRGX_G018333 [Ephydatia muelleri]
MAMKGTSRKDHIEEQINTIKSRSQNNKVSTSWEDEVRVRRSDPAGEYSPKMTATTRIEARLNNALKEKESVSKQLDEALRANAALQSQLRDQRKEEGAKLAAEVEHKENLEAQIMELRQKNYHSNEVMRIMAQEKEELESRLKEMQRQLHQEVEKERQVATEKEMRLMDEVEARLEECCRCMEDQKKGVALVTEEREERDRTIYVLKAQLEDVRLKDQAQIDKLTGDLVGLRAMLAKMENDSDAIVKNHKEKCAALLKLIRTHERDAVRSEKETLQVQCTTQLTLIAQLEATNRDTQTQVKVLREEKAKLVQQTEEYRRELQKAYESDFAKERTQREKLALDFNTLSIRLAESNTEKRSLQQNINSLTARLLQYEGDGGDSYPSKVDKSQEAMRRMAGELEMASKRVEELRSRISSLEAELKRCYKRIEDQKKTIEEERMESVVKKVITALNEERSKELEASYNVQRLCSGSQPQPLPSHSGPQIVASEGSRKGRTEYITGGDKKLKYRTYRDAAVRPPTVKTVKLGGWLDRVRDRQEK